MDSSASKNRLTLLGAVALLVTAIFTIDAGVRGAFPELLGFGGTFLLFVGLQVGAATVLLLRVQRPDSMFGGSE